MDEKANGEKMPPAAGIDDGAVASAPLEATPPSVRRPWQRPQIRRSDVRLMTRGGNGTPGDGGGTTS